jgi:hypothetical protein
MAGQPRTRKAKKPLPADVTQPLEEAGVEAVCALIVETGKTKAAADALGVSKTTMMRWLWREENRPKYEEAQRQLAEQLADETIDIADQCDPAEHSKAKLQISSRQWMASKLDKERYGDQTGPLVNVDMGNLHLGILRSQGKEIEG